MGREGRRINIHYANAYHYDRTAFTYNTYLPTPYIAYNADNGFLLNLGVQFTRQRYGKPGYSTKHNLQSAVSSLGNFTIDYELRLHQALGKWDLVGGGGIGVPANFNYFFGLGNETVKIDSLFDNRFYRTNYDSYFFRLELLREFWKRCYFSTGLEYQNNEANIENGKILDDAELGNVFGRNPVNLVQGIVALNFDFKDNPYIPKRGMQFYLGHKNGFVTSEYNDNFGQTELFLEQYISSRWDNPVTLGIRLGGSHKYGPVPFYNLRYLGQRNNLRGYLRNRFTGDWTAYLNTNLGIQLVEARTSIVPFRIGLHGFFDMGRVWLNEENSTQWHKGYGGGFYIVPLREQFVIYLALGFSEEETGLLMFNLGRFF
jgi:outer membrane protein assembly factor BamA